LRQSAVMTIDPDLIVIDRILAGEQQAYAQLVNQHKRYAFTIALRILQHSAEAEEAAQDSFVKAFHHLKDFNRQSKFSTWLYRIVFNTAVSYKRKHRQVFQDVETTSIVHDVDHEKTLEKDDKQKYIGKAMEKLNEGDRTALTLFYLEEFSLEEIADITSTSANTMKVRIHRARLRLAEELTILLQAEAQTL